MLTKTLFGTSGIRGDSESLFTNQFCFDIGRAFAEFLDNHQQSGPIVIGMDPRGSSPRILKTIEQGLIFAGRGVLDQGASPVPAINYILKVNSAAGGIMVSGSHIAPHLNGIKFFAFQEEILKIHEAEISEIYLNLKNKTAYKDQKDHIKEENNANEEYEEMLVKLGDKMPQWKVVVDPGNGAQSDLMPRVFERLGMQVIAVNDTLQGGFIARDTETEGVLRELQEKVLNKRADFGIAFDADGDRVVFVDEKGNFIPGDYTGSLIAKHSDTVAVVTPVNTSQVVDYLGKSVVRTKVGSPYVVEAMKKYGASFGFEANGGGISAEVMMSRDGGSSAIKILNLIKAYGKTIGKLVKTLPGFYLFRDKIDCPGKYNSEIIKKAKKSYEGKIEEVDGLKIWVDKTSWILFRPSSNSPEFRVFVETKNRQKSLRMGKEGIKFVQNIIGK